MIIYEYTSTYNIMVSVLTKLVQLAARSEAKELIAWTLRPWVRIPLKTWMFVLLFLGFVVLYR
jgi:hypothetical protein